MTIGTEKSRKMTVPERPRRESSPTSFKAVVEDRRAQIPSYRKRSNEAKVLKTKDRKGSGA